VEKCVLSEQRSVASLIAHLSEISKRKGHLELGYKDLFDYCVRRLGLGEGSVYLRLQVAGVARRFPQVLSLLAQNRISLSVAGLLAPHLKDETVERLLSDCERKSRREVEEYLVALKPRPVLEPAIRKKPEPRSSLEAPAAEASLPSLVPSPRSPEKSSSLIQPAEPDVYNFRFSARKDFKEKLLRVAEVLGIEAPEKNLAKILERALDLTLERKDPQKKLERRLVRENAPASRPPRPDEVGGSDRGASAPAKSRYIPLEVRGRVLEQAGYQCEFSGPDGVRCTSRTGLKIEHERPFAIFQSHDEHFLRAYCPRHNRFSAERTYGVDFIRQKIDEKKRERASAASEPCA